MTKRFWFAFIDPPFFSDLALVFLVVEFRKLKSRWLLPIWSITLNPDRMKKKICSIWHSLQKIIPLLLLYLFISVMWLLTKSLTFWNLKAPQDRKLPNPFSLWNSKFIFTLLQRPLISSSPNWTLFFSQHAEDNDHMEEEGFSFVLLYHCWLLSFSFIRFDRVFLSFVLCLFLISCCSSSRTCKTCCCCYWKAKRLTLFLHFVYRCFPRLFQLSFSFAFFCVRSTSCFVLLFISFMCFVFVSAVVHPPVAAPVHLPAKPAADLEKQKG